MIVVFSGPSGVGKSTIINLLKSEFEFYFSISHTTRPMREDEQNYTDYYFCLLYTSPSPRDATLSRMPSSA